MKNILVLDGEEWWATQAIDDTDSVIRSLLELATSCITFNIRFEDSIILRDELGLYNDKHNIELETDKWFLFCASLRESVVAEMAIAVENKLNIFVAKHLKQRRE